MTETTTPERTVEIVESKTVRPYVNGELGPEIPHDDSRHGPRFSVYVDGCWHGSCRTREAAEAAAERERNAEETITERAIRVLRDGLYLITDADGNKYETTDEETAVVCVSGLLGGYYPDKPAEQNAISGGDLVKLAEERPGEDQEIQPITVRWSQSLASMDRVDDISMWHTGGGCLAAGVKLTETDAHLMVTDDEMGYDRRPITDPEVRYLIGAYPDDEGQEWIEDLSGNCDDDAALLEQARKAVTQLTN